MSLILFLPSGPVVSRTECRGPTEPAVTDADVARAFQEVPLPSLRPQTQPRSTTLVNLPTILWTRAEPLSRNVTLLGQQIELRITPISFTWVHGDGTSATTDSPGAPYPEQTITHRYLRRGTVVLRLTTTWSAQWRLAGEAWREVPGSVSTTSDPVALRVREASPTLTR